MVDANYISTDITNKSDEQKVVFIKNTLSQQEIPANFVPLPNSKLENIFFRENGERREWILFENGKFYCVYCLCFSSHRKSRFISGIEYKKGCRCSEALKKHENEINHISAKNIYVGKLPTCDSEMEQKRRDKRIALDSIVKIIIYQATHGTYLMRIKIPRM